MEPTQVFHLVSRATSDSSTPSSPSTGNSQFDQLLNLLQKGFQTQINTTSFVASLGTSAAVTFTIMVLFCFLRPLNNVVYAPRAKYADSKHVPPPIPKHPLGWITPVLKTKEAQLADILGLDATVFLRFARMNRYMFSVLAVIGCGILIPSNLIAGSGNKVNDDPLNKLGPRYVYKGSRIFWSYVVTAYLFDATICFFLWHNYRAVVRLRRAWFDSAEYQQSLAARTLLVMELPKDLRSDQGIVQIAEETLNTSGVPRAAIARNVKELPELVEEHTKAVEQLEEVLAKYLKNPNKVPSQRPVCGIHKKDAAYQRGKKVDAIEYLSGRIQQLERQIKETRQSIDTRNAMNYGFASYQKIEDAHSVAYAARKGGARKTVMRLAPKPHDLIWKNLSMTKSDRKSANLFNNLWVALLTVAWIVPNVFMAVFIANLSNLGTIWGTFQTSLEKHPKSWGVVQGIASPALQSLFYYFLPAIFRRLSVKSGDVSKTSRDRHVLHKLFAFFVFNNLFVYSLFSALWTYVATVVRNSKNKSFHDVYDELRKDFGPRVMLPLETMSIYWLTWLLQRNLGAAVDLAQLVNLAWGSFSRRWRSPTPRQLIKLSAPQPFDYTGYYNYFLFYATVALCFAPFQPLTLPITAVYFWLDSHMKKYLLMYVFITKTESGGKFWRVLFNRVLFNALFGNLVFAMVVISQGSTWAQAIALAPLPFLLVAFKWYCARTFDVQVDYYATKINSERDVGTGEHKSKSGDKIAVRFGHPVLYKKLITPMVHAKAQHLLASLYTGRTSVDLDEPHDNGGYSDMYMNPMSRNNPGKAAKSDAPFEVVGEHEMNFDHFKNRADFRDEAGGDGELYGRSADMVRRPSEQSTMTDMLYGNRAGTPHGHRPGSRSDSISSERTRVDGGATYPAGYHAPGGIGGAHRDHSVDSYSNRSDDFSKPGSRGRGDRDESRTDLLRGAARMGRSPDQHPGPEQYRSGSRGPMMRGWQGESRTPGANGSPGEDTSYDYFRRGRQ